MAPGRIKILFRQMAWVAAVFLIVSFQAFAATDVPANSLFFTPDETKQIEALAAKQLQNRAGAPHPDIHLGAVMYYGPGNWTLWLQGERWTPATNRADLRVLDVEPGEVRLALTTVPDMPPREITLRPHQTYQIATGKIVEGAP